MRATIKGVKISGVCATVPDAVSYFEDEIAHFPFPEKTSRRLGRVMGFKAHRISDASTSHCDLASYTLSYLFHKGYLQKENVQAMVVVAQGSDHPIPGNSKVIHGQLGLPNETFCTDINENCIGYLSGLYSASCMIASGAVDEVVLVTTDCGACYANPKDRNSYPLCGDAATATVISKSENPDAKIDFVFRNDGSLRDALLVPAGGSRMPATAETALLNKDEAGNYRSLNHLHMDGTAVFQFVMSEVPKIVEELLVYAGEAKENIAYFITHQPNRFMLEKLADLIRVPRDILFNNVVENLGNSSPSTIPVNIAYNLRDKMKGDSCKVCYAAFGAGLSLATALSELGPLDFCDFIEHPGNGAWEYRTKGE